MVLTDEELMRFQGESTENRAQIYICVLRCNSCRELQEKSVYCCFVSYRSVNHHRFSLCSRWVLDDIPSCSIYCSAACPISFSKNNLLKILFPSGARSLHTVLSGHKCCWRAFRHFQLDHALCVCVLKRTGSIYKKGGHQDRRQFWISFLHLNLWRNIAEILLLSIHPNFLSWPVKHAQEVVVAQQRRQKTLKMHLYLFVTFAVLGVNEACTVSSCLKLSAQRWARYC